MKYLFTAITLFWFGSLIGQGSNDTSENLLNSLSDRVYILNQGKLISEESQIQEFISEFTSLNSVYIKRYLKVVNNSLAYEMGVIKIDENTFSVMMVKSEDQSSLDQIDLLIIYQNEDTNGSGDDINLAREKWMTLCNNHESSKLVNTLYTADAYYYNRGRLLKGTNDITSEYTYMSNPSYTLKLTPNRVISVSDSITFEIGQCSGSYPLPYMIVWEKQSNGRWMVMLDSNY